MTRPEKEFGEHSNDDIIREILREYASREKPIGKTEIIKHVRSGAVKVMVKNHSTYVLTDQIRTIDKSRLNSYMCTLTRQEM